MYKKYKIIGYAEKDKETLKPFYIEENKKILPYLSYILQDIWELSGSNKYIIKLIKKYYKRYKIFNYNNG
jgi:hypothetical protein